MSYRYVTCKKCTWVSFEVSRKHAEAEVKKFNLYFNSLSKKEQKDNYGGKGAHISGYERCFLCGGSYKNFKRSLKKDIPIGSTIGPIIRRVD